MGTLYKFVGAIVFAFFTFMFIQLYSTNFNNDRKPVIANLEQLIAKAEEQAAELQEEAQSCIDSGYEVSLDGNVITGAVDLTKYDIKIDKEREVVILTTPIHSSSSSTQRTRSVFYPIIVPHF